MTEIDTADLAKLLGLHEFTIWKLFAPAFIGYRQGTSAAKKLYRLDWVAELISLKSGCPVEPDDLYHLLTQQEAIKLMTELGVPRCEASFRHWRLRGVGPRRVKVGAFNKYVRDDIIQWASLLADRKTRTEKLKSLPVPLEEIARRIKETSGVHLSPDQINDLLSRAEAAELLKELGKGRSLGSWARWRREGIGPTPYRADRAVYYLASDVRAWAEQIPTSDDVASRRLGLPRPKPSRVGPIMEPSLAFAEA